MAAHVATIPWNGGVVVRWNGTLKDRCRAGNGEGIGEDGSGAGWQRPVVLLGILRIHRGVRVFLYGMRVVDKGSHC